jgi:hypothetical protein
VSAEINASTNSLTEEGQSVTFTVNASVPNGYVMYYVIVPVSGTVNSGSFADGLMSDSFTVNSNVGTFVKTTAIDPNNDADIFKVEIRISSTSGPKIAESENITIVDVLQNHVLKLTSTNSDDVNSSSIDVDPVDESYYIAGMTRISGSNSNRVLRIYKFSKQGDYLWGRQVAFNLSGGTTAVNVGGIRVDSSRNVVAYCNATSGTGNQRNLFLVKYNSSGTIQWQRNASSTTYSMNVTESQSISLDSSNNIYISASFSSTEYFSWVAKFNASGTFQWQRYVSRVGTLGNDILSNGGCFADSSGNVYITVNGSVNRTNPEMGIVKYSTTGGIQWQRASVDTNGRSLTCITGDASTIIAGGRSSISGSTRAILWAVLPASGFTSWTRFSSTTASLPTFRYMSPRIDSSGDFYAYHDSEPTIFKLASGANQRWARSWTPVPGSISFAGSKYYTAGGALVGYIGATRSASDGSGTGTYNAGGTNFTYGTRSLFVSGTSLSNTAGTYTNNTTNIVSFGTSTFTSSSVTAVSAAVQGF